MITAAGRSKITTIHHQNHNSIFSSSNSTTTTTTTRLTNTYPIINTVTKRFYPRQPKIRIPFQSPWDMLEEYKEREANPPSLRDTKPMKVIGVYDRNVQDNIKALEEKLEKGETPGEQFLNEAPELSSIIERIKQSQAKYEEKIAIREGRKEADSAPQWTPSSRRVGAIALKLGMIPHMDSYGQRLALTALWIPQCQVTYTKTKEKEGYNAVQVGAYDVPPSKVTKPLLGHFQRAGVNPKHAVTEFKVTEDALLSPGTEITSRHFMPGQYVDITGRTKGKGFQGPMKRWGFSGLPASHGVSLTHRSHGSTGQRKSPGRVFKGKRMAGQMGNRQTQTKNLYVFMVDAPHNVIYVHGGVPGSPGSYVAIRDAFFKRFTTPPPFPTFVPDPAEDTKNLPPEKGLLRAEGRKPGDWDDAVEFGKELLKRSGNK